MLALQTTVGKGCLDLDFQKYAQQIQPAVAGLTERRYLSLEREVTLLTLAERVLCGLAHGTLQLHAIHK